MLMYSKNTVDGLECGCHKRFAHRQSLWRHKQTCREMPKNDVSTYGKLMCDCCALEQEELFERSGGACGQVICTHMMYKDNEGDEEVVEVAETKPTKKRKHKAKEEEGFTTFLSTSEMLHRGSAGMFCDSSPPVKKKKRKSFISEKEFNRRLSQEKAAEWENLPEGNIYKLEKCDAVHDHVVGRMTDEYNNKISVYLPQFFLDRLLSQDEKTNIKVYLRRGKASEEVDIVTIEKSTCEHCGRDFSTRKSLDRHIGICSKVV